MVEKRSKNGQDGLKTVKNCQKRSKTTRNVRKWSNFGQISVKIRIITIWNSLFFGSGDIPRILEEEKCQSCPSLGLYGLSRRGRKTKAGLCRQSSIPGKEPNHRSQRTQFPSVQKIPKNSSGIWAYFVNGKCINVSKCIRNFWTWSLPHLWRSSSPAMVLEIKMVWKRSKADKNGQKRLKTVKKTNK